MNIPSNITTYLKRHNAPYEVVPHKKVFTAYDLAQTLRLRLEEIAKTLLVKADTEFLLIVLRASDHLDVAKLKKILGNKKVSVAREKDMEKNVHAKPGAITAFGAVHKLRVVIDKRLTNEKTALFGSGSFEHAIRMKLRDFLTLEQPLIAACGISAGLKLQVQPPPEKKRKR